MIQVASDEAQALLLLATWHQMDFHERAEAFRRGLEGTAIFHAQELTVEIREQQKKALLKGDE